jgi:ABC-type Mn2+/Zn2+ transport system permease subunit
MLMILVTEVVGMKFASAGFAVTAFVIEAAGAFAASKSSEQLTFSFLIGAMVGMLGSLAGISLCLKFAFPPVVTMVGTLLIVLIASFVVGEKRQRTVM